MSREDQYNVTVSVEGLGNLGTFDKFTGGEVDSDEQKYRPGGMAPPVSLGGAVTMGNVVVSRTARPTARLGPIAVAAERRRRRRTSPRQSSRSTSTKFRLAARSVYSGKIKTVTPPDHDSTSSDPGFSISSSCRPARSDERSARARRSRRGRRNGRIRPGPRRRADDDLDDEAVECPPPVSILESLRARAQQLQAEQMIDLDIPGYQGQLVGPLPRGVAAAGAVGRRGDQPDPAQMDDGRRHAGAARSMPLLPRRDRRAGAAVPEPMRFDEDLARDVRAAPGRAVGARRAGRAVRRRRARRVALWTHYMAYQGWLMAGGDEDGPLAQEVADAALGNSRAGSCSTRSRPPRWSAAAPS